MKLPLSFIFPLLVMAPSGCATTTPAPLQHSVVWLSPVARARMTAWLGTRADRRAGDIADTGSMQPTLGARQIVIVEERPFRALKRGDIVLIDAPWAGSVVAHRLTERRSIGEWMTIGDDNRFPDPLLTESSYAGAVVIAAIDKHSGAVSLLQPGAHPAATASPLLAEPDRIAGTSSRRVAATAPND